MKYPEPYDDGTEKIALIAAVLVVMLPLALCLLVLAVKWLF